MTFLLLLLPHIKNKKLLMLDFPLVQRSDMKSKFSRYKGGLSLHNHVNIIVKYVPHKTSTKEKEKQYNIVFFQVQPSRFNFFFCFLTFSYAYSSPATAKSECMGISRSRPLSLEKIHENATITFTYSVDWQQGKTEWAHRWGRQDYCAQSDFVEPYYSVQGGKIHWFAIINSLLVIFILTGMVAVILTKTLRQDFLKYLSTQPILMCLDQKMMRKR